MHPYVKYAIAGIIGVSCVAATPFIPPLVSMCLAGDGDPGSRRGPGNYASGTKGTPDNPFDKPTDGIKGAWGANVLSVWAFGVRFQDWINSFHQVNSPERWGTAASRYDIPGYTDDRWSVRDTATGGFFHGVN